MKCVKKYTKNGMLADIKGALRPYRTRHFDYFFSNTFSRLNYWLKSYPNISFVPVVFDHLLLLRPLHTPGLVSFPLSLYNN